LTSCTASPRIAARGHVISFMKRQRRGPLAAMNSSVGRRPAQRVHHSFLWQIAVAPATARPPDPSEWAYLSIPPVESMFTPSTRGPPECDVPMTLVEHRILVD